MNEADTKAEYVDPALKAAGWRKRCGREAALRGSLFAFQQDELPS